MNYDNEIKKANAAKAKAEEKIERCNKKVRELNEMISETISKVHNLDADIARLHREKHHKWACHVLEKAYDFLHIDEIYDNTVWFSCDLYDEHNEESDPYYDAHFACSWSGVHDAFLEYITIANDKKETA